MNIMIILQQSVYTNGGKWTTADSNIQMHLGFIRNALKIDPDVNFYVVLAPERDFCDIMSYDELIKDDRVYFISRPVPVNAFYGRIHFDAEWYQTVLDKEFMKAIDVVINNEPCLTRNLKTYFHFAGIKVPIVTQNFWMDCPEIGEGKVDEIISYDWRQIDGVVCSDLVPFTCESTKEAFFLNLVKKFGSSFCEKFLLKNIFTIWDMGFDADEFPAYHNTKPEEFEKKTIVFPNRMSSINYTHHLEFIEAVKILAKRRDDFQVIFCNPSGKIEWSWLKENVPNLFVYKEGILTRAEYLQILRKSHVGVSLYTMERYGGCANVEMLYSGLKVVMPEVFEYKIRGGEDYQYYVNLPLDPENIANQLSHALSTCYPETHHAICNRLLERSSYEEVSKNILSDLKIVIRNANQ